MAEFNANIHDILQEDSEVAQKRNPSTRLLVAGFCVIAMFALTCGLAVQLLSIIDASGAGWIIGVVIGLVLLKPVAPRVTVNVPAYQAVVTYDPLSKTNVVYGPGFHPRFPWEEIHRTSHFSLKTETITVPTETMASRDAEMQVTYTIQYVPMLSALEIFRGVETSTIEKGVVGLTQAYLSRRVSDMTGQEAREATELLSKEALAHFNEQSNLESVGKQYGIRFVYINVNDIDYSKGVQAARDSVAKAEALSLIMAGLAGYKTDTPRKITSAKNALKEMQLDRPREYKALLDRALIATGQVDGQTNIVELSGLEGIAGSIAALVPSINHLVGKRRSRLESRTINQKKGVKSEPKQ